MTIELQSIVADALVKRWNEQTYAGQTAMEDAETAIEAIREAVESDPSLSIVPTEWQRHVVELEENGFFLEHSVECRIAGMRDCRIHASLSDLADAPAAPGRYRVVLADGALRFIPVES